MRRIRIALPAFALITAVALMIACSSKNNQGLKPTGGENTIIGAGSTFIFPVMTRWISAFQGSHQDVQINYHW